MKHVPSQRLKELYFEIKNLENETGELRKKLAEQAINPDFYLTDGDFPGEYSAAGYIDALTRLLEANDILLDAARKEFLTEIKKRKLESES